MPAPIITNEGSYLDIRIVAGVAWAMTCTLDIDGVPINLAGNTFAAQLRTASGTLAATATCTITNAAAGQFTVALTGAQTAALQVGTEYMMSVNRTASGVTSEVVRSRSVSIVTGVTA